MGGRRRRKARAAAQITPICAAARFVSYAAGAPRRVG